MVIRRGVPEDLPVISAIQNASPGAARWEAADYLSFDLLVAASETGVAGFVCGRETTSSEREILNIAVEPGYRRTGVGRALIGAYLQGFHGDVFLEVRKSNLAAIEFYKSFGFQQVGVRREYYLNPGEDGVVMKLFSC